MSLTLLGTIDYSAQADTVAGAAGNTTSAPGLTDLFGGVASVSGHKLKLVTDNPAASDGFNRDLVLFPSANNRLNQQVSVVANPCGVTGLNIWAFARYQGGAPGGPVMYGAWMHAHNSSDFDCIQIGVTDGTGGVYGIVSSTASGLFTWNAAHAYRLDFAAVGAGPTTLTATLTDLTLGSVVATLTGTDATPALQMSGGHGVTLNGAGSQALIGGVSSYDATPGATIPAPSLTATAQFVAGQPAVILTGS